MTSLPSRDERSIRDNVRWCLRGIALHPWRYKGRRVSYPLMTATSAWRVDVSPIGTRRNGTLLIHCPATDKCRTMPYSPDCGANLYVNVVDMIEPASV